MSLSTAELNDLARASLSEFVGDRRDNDPKAFSSMALIAGRLTNILHNMEIPDNRLDDIVHDICMDMATSVANQEEDRQLQDWHTSSGESMASGINNRGKITQIAFLVASMAPEDAECQILEAAGLSPVKAPTL